MHTANRSWQRAAFGAASALLVVTALSLSPAVADQPDTLTTNLAYGATQCQDILLESVFTPVFITAFDAEVRGGAVEVSWQVWSDETLDRFELFRYDDPNALARVVASGRFDANTRSFRDDGVHPGQSYRYELVITAADGEVVRSPIVDVAVPALVTTLWQNFPNPFNPKTTISYTLADRAHVALGVYDATGKLVVRIDQGTREAGTHRVEWAGNDANGKPVGSGVYFYRLEGVKGIAPRKMVLLK